MRVLIDTTYAERAPYSGTGIYLRELVSALRERDAIEVQTTANPHRRPPGGGGVASVRNAIADFVWTEQVLPAQARRRRADLIHHPLPAIAHETRTPQVITVHDLAFERLPDAFDPWFRRYAHLAHRHAARHAAAVITPSRTTADDVRDLWGVKPQKITVAPHGPGQASTEAGEAAASPPRHYLYVGDEEPRKDLATLRRAIARSPLPLVHPRDATPAELVELHRHAAALVQPSRYEGFGLTALEAMALGTPVIAARSPGLIETCGDAARYFTPGDADDLANALAELATDERARDALRVAGRRRAAQFSWENAARQHIAAYSLALKRCA